jgi:hypothetical protein
MTHRPLIISILIAGLFLAGCQVDLQPQDVSHFSTNRAATKEIAAYNGNYSLYRDDTDQVAGPLLMSRHLNKGETVGFDIDANHVPFAVAGKDRLQLDTGRYRWAMKPDPGQTDWDKSNTLIIEVVVGTAVAVLIVVAAIVAAK